MRALALRLNEIITKTPIINFDEQDSEIETFLYNSVIGAYKYAYVNADSQEQFNSDFTDYWNRNIRYYKDALYSQISLGENLYKARIEKHEGGTNLTETPNLTDTEKWTFGRIDETSYGRKLTLTPDITETDNGSNTGSDTVNGEDKTHTVGNATKYNSQIVVDDTTVTRTPTNLKTDIARTVENTHKRTGTEEHINSGTDTVTSSGENGRSLTRNGNKEVVFTDSRTNTVTTYDPERLYNLLRNTNIVDRFIDLFSPLFNDMLMIDGGIFGGVV